MSLGNLTERSSAEGNVPSQICWEATGKVFTKRGHRDPNCCNKIPSNHPETCVLTEQKGDSRMPWQEAGKAGDMAGVRGVGELSAKLRELGFLREREMQMDQEQDVTAYIGSYLATQSMQMCKCDKK